MENSLKKLVEDIGISAVQKVVSSLIDLGMFRFLLAVKVKSCGEMEGIQDRKLLKIVSEEGTKIIESLKKIQKEMENVK